MFGRWASTLLPRKYQEPMASILKSPLCPPHGNKPYQGGCRTSSQSTWSQNAASPLAEQADGLLADCYEYSGSCSYQVEREHEVTNPARSIRTVVRKVWPIHYFLPQFDFLQVILVSNYKGYCNVTSPMKKMIYRQTLVDEA